MPAHAIELPNAAICVSLNTSQAATFILPILSSAIELITVLLKAAINSFDTNERAEGCNFFTHDAFMPFTLEGVKLAKQCSENPVQTANIYSLSNWATCSTVKPEHAPASILSTWVYFNPCTASGFKWLS